jgi:hypothetical protein
MLGWPEWPYLPENEGSVGRLPNALRLTFPFEVSAICNSTASTTDPGAPLRDRLGLDGISADGRPFCAR